MWVPIMRDCERFWGSISRTQVPMDGRSLTQFVALGAAAELGLARLSAEIDFARGYVVIEEEIYSLNRRTQICRGHR